MRHRAVERASAAAAALSLSLSLSLSLYNAHMVATLPLLRRQRNTELANILVKRLLMIYLLKWNKT